MTISVDTQMEERDLTVDGVSDARLAARAKGGDSGALVALYRRYVGEIHAYVHSQVGNAQDAEDVTSETFLRMVRSLPAFEGRSAVRTWLYVIARNCVSDHWRRDERRAAALDDLDSFPARVDTVPAARPEVTTMGRAILDRLPPRYREVIALRVIDGRSVRDTAEVMQTSESNVKVLQHRALRRAARLALELQEREDGHEATA
jgi:RNA polymerase sigma-70 factor (ECF subfamily)